MSDQDQIKTAEDEFFRLREFIPASEKERVEAQRDGGSGYGHDLFAAVRRGKLNCSIELARTMLESEWVHGSFGLALSVLIDAQLRYGKPPKRFDDDNVTYILETMERMVKCHDSTSVASRAKRLAEGR